MTFEERQYKQMFDMHLRNAKFNVNKLIENAGYIKSVLDKMENGHDEDDGDPLLPGDHLVTYVFAYERALAALDALREYREVLKSGEGS